jgi:hypothetical protein
MEWLCVFPNFWRKGVPVPYSFLRISSLYTFYTYVYEYILEKKRVGFKKFNSEKMIILKNEMIF